MLCYDPEYNSASAPNSRSVVFFVRPEGPAKVPGWKGYFPRPFDLICWIPHSIWSYPVIPTGWRPWQAAGERMNGWCWMKFRRCRPSWMRSID